MRRISTVFSQVASKLTTFVNHAPLKRSACLTALVGGLALSQGFANEPARHKVLDMLGDLFLLGHDLCGHLVACRSGHPLNIELVLALSRQLSQVLPWRRLAA